MSRFWIQSRMLGKPLYLHFHILVWDFNAYILYSYLHGYVYIDYTLRSSRSYLYFHALVDMALNLALINWVEWPTMCKRGAYTLFACGCTLHSGSCGRSRGWQLRWIHLRFVGLVGSGRDGSSQALFLRFLSNAPICMNMELIFCYN